MEQVRSMGIVACRDDDSYELEFKRETNKDQMRDTPGAYKVRAMIISDLIKFL